MLSQLKSILDLYCISCHMCRNGMNDHLNLFLDILLKWSEESTSVILDVLPTEKNPTIINLQIQPMREKRSKWFTSKGGNCLGILFAKNKNIDPLPKHFPLINNVLHCFSSCNQQKWNYEHPIRKAVKFRLCRVISIAGTLCIIASRNYFHCCIYSRGRYQQ